LEEKTNKQAVAIVAKNTIKVAPQKALITPNVTVTLTALLSVKFPP
jgi:hypothetical protein